MRFERTLWTEARTEIEEVIAYKADNFTWDTIWLQFEVKSGETLAVSEDATGWREFVELLPEVLPGCESIDKWVGPVSLPPFEENLRLVYKNDSGRNPAEDP